MAIGNMHKNLVKIGCVFPQICSWTDKYTDRQTRSSQYSTALLGWSNQKYYISTQLKYISVCQIKQFKMWYSNDVVI